MKNISCNIRIDSIPFGVGRIWLWYCRRAIPVLLIVKPEGLILMSTGKYHITGFYKTERLQYKQRPVRPVLQNKTVQPVQQNKCVTGGTK